MTPHPTDDPRAMRASDFLASFATAASDCGALVAEAVGL